MQINILTCSVSRASGGLFEVIKSVYQQLSRTSNSTIEIYSYEDSYTENDKASWEGLSMQLYPKNNLFFYSKNLRNDLLNSKADILHVHGLWRYPHTFIGTWNKYKNQPVVVSPHGMLDPYILKNQGKVKRFISGFLFPVNVFNKVACYHALNQQELTHIRNYGITQPVAIIPNGVFIPSESTTVKYSKKRDDKKHILYLGRLHPKKGIDILIDAFAQLVEQEPILTENWVLDIVGWSDEGFGDIIERQISQMQISEKIILHGGLFGNEKEKMFAQCDLYILPSHGEGMPMSVLEAWSWKKPVLMSQYCNLPEGFLCEAAIDCGNTQTEVFENLRHALKLSDNERKTMGENGYQLVRENFTWEKSSDKMKELYGWLIGDCPKPNFVEER